MKKLQYNDDCLQAQLDAQISGLENEDLASFDIVISGLNSFASAPFFEILDPDNGITHLRQLLSKGAPEFRTVPYRPHLTIGQYANSFPSKEVLNRMATFTTNPVRLKIEKVTLATYRSNDIVGELNPLYNVCLKD